MKSALVLSIICLFCILHKAGTIVFETYALNWSLIVLLKQMHCMKSRNVYIEVKEYIVSHQGIYSFVSRNTFICIMENVVGKDEYAPHECTVW